jgi:hypothetical protein
MRWKARPASRSTLSKGQYHAPNAYSDDCILGDAEQWELELVYPICRQGFWKWERSPFAPSKDALRRSSSYHIEKARINLAGANFVELGKGKSLSNRCFSKNKSLFFSLVQNVTRTEGFSLFSLQLIQNLLENRKWLILTRGLQLQLTPPLQIPFSAIRKWYELLATN